MLTPDGSPIPVPELTAQVARTLFLKSNTLTLMRDTLGTAFYNQYFGQLSPTAAARSDPLIPVICHCHAVRGGAI